MHINRKLLHYCRMLHVYLTMLGLFVMLGFGITGFTVNHEDWFGATTPRLTEIEGNTPAALIEKNDSLRIVEHLRSTFHITGAMSSFDVLDDRLAIAFKSPGTSWEIEIDKSTGKTLLHKQSHNLFAVINDLHRGRDSGPAWSWVIDISAILIVLACITGVVLWLALPKRRNLGIAALIVGTLSTIAVYRLLVPGSDITAQVKTAPTTAAE